MAPKLIVSHAGEDKAGALSLASRLRADGVDVWIDSWEILAGDSLVEKIFAEAIGQCDVFLIVLSRSSVTKPWVREELNAAFVEMLEREMKLMPVRIDDCAVPVSLKSRRRLEMNLNGEHEAAYQELLAAIFNRRERPALGTAEPHLLRQAPGYTADETAVWDALVRTAAESGPGNHGSAAVARALPDLKGNRLWQAVEVLQHDGLVSAERCTGGAFSVRLTPFGWRKRANDVLGIDVEQDQLRVLAALASEGVCNGVTLAKRVELSEARLFMTVECLESGGLVKVHRAAGRGVHGFYRIDATVEGRRRMRVDA